MKRHFLLPCCAFAATASSLGYAADTVSLSYLDIAPRTAQQKVGKLKTNNAATDFIARSKINQQSRPDFQLKPISKVVLNKTALSKDSLIHTRYQQYFQGIPVWGREVVLHTDKQGSVKKLNGTISDNIKLKLPAALTAQQGLSAKGKSTASALDTIAAPTVIG
jgi:Zn-dependent metalloprotease